MDSTRPVELNGLRRIIDDLCRQRPMAVPRHADSEGNGSGWMTAPIENDLLKRSISGPSLKVAA
jgi:hypothetical protein